MKINTKYQVIFLFIFLLFLTTAYAAEDSKSELQEITSRIKAEEVELAKLKGEKNATAKRLKLIGSKIENYRRMIKTIDKDTASGKAKLKETEGGITRSKANIKKIRSDVSKSNIFVIDNLGYSYIKIISTAKNPEGTIMTLEILSRAGNSLESKVKELNASVKELALLTELQKKSLSDLEVLKNERSRALKALVVENKEYQNTLVLLQHDEAGRLEYVDMLKFQRKELDDRVREAAKRSAELREVESTSVFTKLKGSIPWPILGKVLEPFGNRIVQEAKVEFFHKGWKIRPNKTSDVLNPVAGKIVFADYMKGFENLIIVSHGSGYYTVYGNLTDISVEPNLIVHAGDVLGRIGVDPQNNTSYLYFEIRKNEEALDPANWLAAYGRR